MREILRAALQDPPTFSAIRAERAFLKRLGGGCQMPVGALGRVAGGSLELQGVVAAEDGRGILEEVGSAGLLINQEPPLPDLHIEPIYGNIQPGSQLRCTE